MRALGPKNYGTDVLYPSEMFQDKLHGDMD